VEAASTAEAASPGADEVVVVAQDTAASMAAEAPIMSNAVLIIVLNGKSRCGAPRET